MATSRRRPPTDASTPPDWLRALREEPAARTTAAAEGLWPSPVPGLPPYFNDRLEIVERFHFARSRRTAGKRLEVQRAFHESLCRQAGLPGGVGGESKP